ncbi:uncharacterized protein LOC134841551 [Symsagittifera roscoffensis]|uniref:uncharacterized protein LOC134841551 n=1 Tax=Symsagittifera roscoffensis TaxID=84072 RepID=UPI00307B7DA4
MSFDLGNTLRSVVLVVVCVAIVACIAFLIRSRRLEKTNFVRYCMVLAASDLSISICFISNFSGLGAAFKSDIYQQIVAGYIMVFGLFSLNTQALIAVERFMSARILIRARRPYTTSKFMAITLFGGFLPALLTTALMVSIMYPENTFEIDAQTMHFGVNWNPKSIQGISMIVMLLLLEYLTPLIVIGGCYASILTLHNKRAVFYTSPRISRR